MLAWISFWVILPTTLSLGSPNGRSRPQYQTPVSQIDVRALGYAPWRPREGFQSEATISQICFLGHSRVAVTFTSNTVPKVPPRRDQPGVSSRVLLHAIFLDAHRGQVVGSREWPVSSRGSRIAPVPGGGFVVVTPDRLLLYSPDLRRLKELDLPQEPREAWDVIPSPAERYLLISYDPPGGDWVHPSPTMSALINTATLQVVLPWAGRGYGLIPLDDGRMLTSVIAGTPPTTDVPAVGPPSGPWRPVLASYQRGCKPLNFWPAGNGVLFGQGGTDTHLNCYTLTTTTGEILFERRFSDNVSVPTWALPKDALSRSVGGQRFAIYTQKCKGGSLAFDIAPHCSMDRIMVYDIPSRQWIFTLDGKKQGIKAITGLALSPDGSLLALIDQNGTLQVYRVPKGTATASPEVQHDRKQKP